MSVVARNAPLSLAPVHGQPGVFRRRGDLEDYLDGYAMNGAGMRGLGGPLEDAQTKLRVTQRTYDDLKARATTLLSRWGPLDTSTLTRLMQLASSTPIGRPVILSAAAFTGVVRMSLAAATGNIVRARAILERGTEPGREARANVLLNAAKNSLRALDSLIAGAEVAQGPQAAAARRLGLSGSGLGFVIADDAILAIIAVVGVVVLAALIASVYTYTHQSTAASDTADAACEADAAAGRPCTGDDYVRYRAAAIEQEHSLSPFPDFSPLIRQTGSLIFWGGLLAVGGLLAYGAWTAAPAAQITRERLRARAAAF